MTDRARTSARRLVRSTRRFAKSALKRLGLGPSAPKPYKPEFSDQRLAARLGIPATDERKYGESDRSLGLAFSGARRAREVFGKRFFVAPAKVGPLCETLETLRPGSIAELMSRVDADYREGIPVYAQQGPPLGPAFPWNALPLGPGGDHMYRKRPHRFAFVPRNALASLFQPAAAVRLDGMLDGWMRHAGQGRDPLCHDSNLAVIQRLLALSWGWAFLAGRQEEESAQGLALEWRLMMIIEADVRFLEPLLGQSAPNNHLLADRFAAWFLRTVFPELLDSPDSGDHQRWCDELLAQTYPDGGSFEHSSHYHEFACEMGAAYLLLSKRCGMTPDPRVNERVRALLAYQCAMTGPEACPLPIGNAIEDTLFPLDAGEGWCSGSLREMYRTLFESSLSPTQLSDETFVRAFWLLAGRIAPFKPGTNITLPKDFIDAGLHVMVDDTLCARVAFRTGPAAELPLAAGHMHADILSITMNINGLPVLVDPGTYTYRKSAWKPEQAGLEPDWRSYFSGPYAHNGLSVEGADPLGTLNGDFRKRDTSCRVNVDHGAGNDLSYIAGAILAAGPYSGTQRICIHVRGEYWLILDKPPHFDTPDHKSWYGLQFAPSVTLEQSKQNIEAAYGDGAARLFITSCKILQQPNVLIASLEPLGGWVGTRYGELRGAPQLRFPVGGQEGVFSFLLSTANRHGNAELVSTSYRPNGSWTIRLKTSSNEDLITFRTPGNEYRSASDDEPVFDGTLLWIRLTDGQPQALRWLAATYVEWDEKGIKVQLREESPLNVSITPPYGLRPDRTEFAQFKWPGI